MRTETIIRTLYTIDELPEDVKQRAIENLSDINVDYKWWDCIIDDAEEIGLKIKEFDIDRGSYVKGEFINNPETVANKIITNHGEVCDTHQTALTYLSDIKNVNPESEEREELDNEFLYSLCEDYRITLKKDYEYRCSEEAILETIKANSYEFTEYGELV